MQTIRIVIGDDHEIVRMGARLSLEAAGGFEIVAEIDNGFDAIAAVKMHRPDIMLLDVAMPSMTGIEVIEEARRWSPETRIVIMTGLKSAAILSHARDSGAAGIFLKSEDMRMLPTSLHAVHAGQTVFSPSVEMLLTRRESQSELTPRERQILFGIARGETNAQQAENLGISPSTVDKHRTSLMRKLNAHSVAQLLAVALREGLLEPSKHA